MGLITFINVAIGVSLGGDSFDWLYIDFNTLNLYARQAGFKAEKIENGEHYDYLARISYF